MSPPPKEKEKEIVKSRKTSVNLGPKRAMTDLCNPERKTLPAIPGLPL
jgi:hypothetical protein